MQKRRKRRWVFSSLLKRRVKTKCPTERGREFQITGPMTRYWKDLSPRVFSSSSVPTSKDLRVAWRSMYPPLRTWGWPGARQSACPACVECSLHPAPASPSPSAAPQSLPAAPWCAHAVPHCPAAGLEPCLHHCYSPFAPCSAWRPAPYADWSPGWGRSGVHVTTKSGKGEWSWLVDWLTACLIDWLNFISQQWRY